MSATATAMTPQAIAARTGGATPAFRRPRREAWFGAPEPPPPGAP